MKSIISKEERGEGATQWLWDEIILQWGPRDQVQRHQKEIMFSCPWYSLKISLAGWEQANRKAIDEFREVI